MSKFLVECVRQKESDLRAFLVQFAEYSDVAYDFSLSEDQLLQIVTFAEYAK